MAEGKELDRIDKLLLVEYKKAQDSAQHMDHMGWLISSILIAASVILLTGVISYYDGIVLLFKVGASVLGIFISILIIFLFNNADNSKNQKYDRCKDIERHFRIKYQNREIMKQHIFTSSSGARGFYLSFIILLAIIWSIILIASLSLG